MFVKIQAYDANFTQNVQALGTFMHSFLHTSTKEFGEYDTFQKFIMFRLNTNK